MTENTVIARKFAEVFQLGPNVKWSYQIRKKGESDVEYWDQGRTLDLTDWVNHVEQKARSLGNGITESGISIRLTDETGNVKLLCIDCDHSDAVEAADTYILPELDARNIDYIWETSGIDGDRGHLWIRTIGTLQVQRAWIENLFQQIGVDIRDRKYKFEVFPALKPNHNIRVPASLHQRTGKINTCTFKDQTSNDPDEVVNMFMRMRPVTDAEMRGQIVVSSKDKERAKLAPIRRAFSSSKSFFYMDQNMPVEVKGLPRVIDKIARNCPAVNKILDMIVNERFANERGGDVHSAGLSLWGMALYNDLILNGQQAPAGEKWAEEFFGKHRTRSYQSHQWKSDKEKYAYEKERLMTSCAKWQEIFNLCDGCVHKNRVGFKNPKQIFWGKPIKRKAQRPVTLVTQEWVRRNTFKRVRDRLRQLMSSPNTEKRNILMCSPQGTGKCLGLDTPILMFDGTIKMVQDVVVGDLLMGPDSQHRRVESLARGREEMFKLTPVKGDSHIFNRSHILSLKFSGHDYGLHTGDVVNIPIGDFLSRSDDFQFRCMLYRTDVDFSEQPTQIDPWVLGYWLGDGTSSSTGITTADKECKDSLALAAEASGLTWNSIADGNMGIHFSITNGKSTKGNTFKDSLLHYGLINNKHVPQIYKSNSREARLQLIAGLIDSDGSLSSNGYDWINKNKQLAEDFAWLCRSVGLAAYIKPCQKSCISSGVKVTGDYWRVSVSGDTSAVPCRVVRKQATQRLQKKNALVTNFNLESIGEGDYYGFEVSGPDRLFVLGDFTVTHNSYFADEAAIDVAQMVELVNTSVDVARRRKRVLISVPTGDLAVEHKRRIDEAGAAYGVKAFMMGSQQTCFNKYIPNFKREFPECPFQSEIDKHKDLGVGSSVYKEAFCGNCTLEYKCPFPNQYTQMLEEEYQVVIVQHAHFTSSQAMEAILKKHFDIMFIDEAIVDALITNLKAREAEWEVLGSLSSHFDWAEDVSRWMRDGGYPQIRKRINLSVEDADQIKKVFTANAVDWRLPDFLRYYNQGLAMDANLGLWIFTPLPTDRIPICVILDATPPKEIYEIMLDDKNIEVYGEDEILDYRKMNPNNRVIQVLDSSMSKTALRGPRNEDGEFDYIKFIEILDFIADKAREEYKEKKILITVYGGEFWRVAETYLSRNYPDLELGSRVILGKMSIGTNKFEDCDVQFLVAGVYLSARDSHMQAYKFRIMANYWNVLKGRPIMPNFFHYDVGPDASIDREKDKVTRIEAVGNHAYVFEYENFEYMRPVETFHWLAENYMIAKTQQSLRLRYNNDKEKVTWIFGKFFFRTFLITDTVLEEDLLGYLRTSDEHQFLGADS